MKTNAIHFLTNFGAALVIAIIIVLISAISTTKAQEQTLKLPNFSSVLNGIFTPNAAERFFEEGRKDFEREVDFLAQPDKYFNGDLLDLDPELLEQMQEALPSEKSQLEAEDSCFSKSVFTGY